MWITLTFFICFAMEYYSVLSLLLFVYYRYSIDYKSNFHLFVFTRLFNLVHFIELSTKGFFLFVARGETRASTLNITLRTYFFFNTVIWFTFYVRFVNTFRIVTFDRLSHSIFEKMRDMMFLSESQLIRGRI